MKQIITSGLAATIAILGAINPAFAASITQPSHASSTVKTGVTTNTTTSPTTVPHTKKILLIGSVAQNSGGTLTVLNKTTSYMVTVGTAMIVNKAGTVIALSSIKTGDKIRVRGSVSGTQVTATSMRDLSL